MINNKDVVKKASKKLLLNLVVTNSTRCVNTRKKMQHRRLKHFIVTQMMKKNIYLGSPLDFIPFYKPAHKHRPSCVLFKFKAKIVLLSHQLGETWTLSQREHNRFSTGFFESLLRLDWTLTSGRSSLLLTPRPTSRTWIFIMLLMLRSFPSDVSNSQHQGDTPEQLWSFCQLLLVRLSRKLFSCPMKPFFPLFCFKTKSQLTVGLQWRKPMITLRLPKPNQTRKKAIFL